MRRMELDAKIWYGASLCHLESSPKGASKRYFIFFKVSRTSSLDIWPYKEMINDEKIEKDNPPSRPSLFENHQAQK